MLNRNIKVLTDELHATEEIPIEETITEPQPEPKESKGVFKIVARKTKEIYSKTVDVIRLLSKLSF